MLGAILGDVVGSKYEFKNIKAKNFDLFTNENCFTDDTVMTIAIADAILCGYVPDNNQGIINKIKTWGQKYPNAGYGGRFFYWVLSDEREPYNSFGNGAAMRVSPIGWISNTFEEVVKNATAVTAITHNHPEGIKAAIVIANSIRMARQKESKENIIKYIKENYNIDFDYNDLVKNFKYNEATCQATVPQALYCFAISKDFEDCLRTTISIGGDCDTTAAMSCAIAEALYGVPDEMAKKVYEYLDENQIDIVNRFYEKWIKN